MGLAKYYEDNYEMVSERIAAMERSRVEPYIEITTVLPLAVFPIKMEIGVVTQQAAEQPLHSKKLQCVCCGKEFVFSKKEQRFYQSKHFSTPKRCRQCRKQRRLELAALQGEKVCVKV